MVGNDDVRSEVFGVLEKFPDGVRLFRGPSGAGKRTFAFECAKRLLCLDKGYEGCLCRSCELFEEHSDFLCLGRYERIKAADIELLLDFLSTVSLLSSRKVIVLDNVNDMSRGSSNKLLKILEDYGPKCSYFLISSEELPFTLSSRAVEYRFNNLLAEEASWVAMEKLGYDKRKANILGLFSAMSADEVFIKAGHYLQYKEDIYNILHDFKKKTIIDFFDLIDSMDNLEVFLNVLLMSFTDILLAKNGIEMRFERLKPLTEMFNDKGLIYSVSLLSRLRKFKRLNVNLNMAMKNVFFKIHPVLQS